MRDDETPTEVSLSQNYPNPFNPSTTIQFSIPATEHVSIKVYNTVCQEVDALIDGEFSAGTYTTEWNATGMASGVYLCQMKAGDFTDTRRLVLMK